MHSKRKILGKLLLLLSKVVGARPIIKLIIIRRRKTIILLPRKTLVIKKRNCYKIGLLQKQQLLLLKILEILQLYKTKRS